MNLLGENLTFIVLNTERPIGFGSNERTLYRIEAMLDD